MPSLSSILSRLQPFGLGWLVVFLSVSTWSNLYVFCWYVRVTPDIVSTIQPVPVVNSLGFGLFLLVISAIFKANWVGAWVQSLVITWFCDRKWKPSRACKDIMQVDSAAWQGAHSSQRGVWIRYQEGLRPRKCNRQGHCGFRLSDRVYHCERLGRCLPLFDHYSPFLKVVVYLRTIKAYVTLCNYVFYDAGWSVLLSMVGIASYPAYSGYFVATILVTFIMLSCLSQAGVFPTVRRLVDKNCLDMETDYSPKVPRAWNFAFRYGPTAEPRLHLKTFKGQHPWDLGIKENTCQVLGRHWWQRFLFCWQPERVARYGQYGGRDLPYADFIVRYRTELLMPTLTHVAIDDGSGVPPPHGAASTTRRRHQGSSTASYGSR